MALNEKLSAAVADIFNNAPEEVTRPIFEANSDFKASFKSEDTIQVNDTFPTFCLSNATGKEVTRDELISKGPILITFYRGNWCPFCNLELRELQKRLPEFIAKGVTLVAISPELPDSSLSTTEKNELQFTVLSDVGNKLARQLGIIFPMPDTLRPVFDKFGQDMVKQNGDNSFEVPVPATILVDGKGIVRNLYIEPDYTKRLEPSTALEWADALKA